MTLSSLSLKVVSIGKGGDNDHWSDVESVRYNVQESRRLMSESVSKKSKPFERK